MSNLSPLLDFLIAFVYVLAICSTLLSIVYELVSYWLRSRPAYLYKALNEVLNDNKLNNLNLTEIIYNFPQIDFTKKTFQDKPSYISAKNFATSLVLAFNDYYKKQNMLFPPNEQSAIFAPGKNISEEPFQLFAAAVKNLKVSDLKTLLESFINGSNANYDTLINNIELWYNDYMDRVTGWFKIRTQKRMFWIAIPVAILFNLNFLNIGEKLYSDKTSTAILVSMAEKWKPNNVDSIMNAEDFKKALKEKKCIVDSLQRANVPMGWSKEDIKNATKEWLKSILGWLLMAAAMVMGAPFWYDLLNRLVNMRKAGLKPNTNTSKLSN
jgi:hypothetical protein